MIVQIDNVVYDSNLGTAENTYGSQIRFALATDHNTLKFASPTTLSAVKIYTAVGQQVA